MLLSNRKPVTDILLFIGVRERLIQNEILLQIANQHKHRMKLEDAYATSAGIYAGLVAIEFWSRIPWIGNWKRIGSPMEKEIEILKEYMTQDQDLAKELFGVLLRHEPIMLRRIRKHLQKAGIPYATPTSQM